MKKYLISMLVLLGVVFFLGNNSFARGPHMQMRGMERFDELDTDQDGKISKEEHMTKCEKCFEAMDTNDDGYVSKEECREAWENRMETVKDAKEKAIENMNEKSDYKKY
jgi:Ca2+-binding EF-hand superfamily protein